MAERMKMKINSTNFCKLIWGHYHGSLVAMEPMVSFNADEIRHKKGDVLHAVRPIHPDFVHQCVLRGQ